MVHYLQLALLSFLAAGRTLAAPSPDWAAGDYNILEATHRTKGIPISVGAHAIASTSSTSSTASSTGLTTSSSTSTKASSSSSTSSSIHTSQSTSFRLIPSILNSATSSSLWTISAASTRIASSTLVTSSSPSKTSAATSTASLSCPGSDGAQYTAGGQAFVIQCFVDHAGGDMGSVPSSTLESCLAACASASQCVDVAWVPGTQTCYMKSVLKTGVTNNNVWGAQLLNSSPSSSSLVSLSSLASSTTSIKSSSQTSSTILTSTLLTSTKPTITTLATSSNIHLTSSSASASATLSVGKRGMAYNDASLASLFKSSNEVTWGYNWWQECGGLSKSFDFVPMLWGASSGFTDTWATNVANSLAAGSSHILSFNEPDLAQQSNMTPSAAATAYKQWIQPYANQAKLVSPAITNGDTPTMGFNWMTSFIQQCTGCTIDVIAIHWYNNPGTNQDFKNHVTTAYQTYGKPIWITEFGLNNPTNDQATAFLEDVLPWLDEQDFVQRYAYFMVAEGVLVNNDGSALSSYGSTFATYTG